MKQFLDRTEAQTLALAIVETLPDPFLVLDDKFEVIAASRCFYEAFEDDPTLAHGLSVFRLTGGRWDVTGLRDRLENVIHQKTPIEEFEFEQDFANLGKRTIQLSARPIHNQSDSNGMVLVAIKDITAHRLVEQEKERLLVHTEELFAQQKTLLREMRHRIANSLQIIASILLLKARGAASEETRSELRDAHQRVTSVAAVQSHLHDQGGIDQIDVHAYLSKLGAGLALSMLGPKQNIRIIISADDGTLASSQAVNLGLIVTELVINAIKHAFPTHREAALIRVTFGMNDAGWKLTVEDNGTGRSKAQTAKLEGGLGTALMSALAKRLDASISEVSTDAGLTVAVTHGTLVSLLPLAA